MKKFISEAVDEREKEGDNKEHAVKKFMSAAKKFVSAAVGEGEEEHEDYYARH